MGELKKHTEDWLAECGYKLGYDWDCLPNEDDFDKIKTKRIYRRTYGKRKNNTNTH